MNRLKILLLLISVSLTGCETKDNIEVDINLMQSLERFVQLNYQSNQDLSDKIESSEEIRELVRETFSNIFEMEEHVIAASGGYKHVEPYGNRINILNSELKDAVGFIRNNPYGITLDYLNRVSDYIESKGLELGDAFRNPSDDPYVGSEPEFKNVDYFQAAFSNRNVYQIITVFHEIKLEILHQERQYLQYLLKECNTENSL